MKQKLKLKKEIFLQAYWIIFFNITIFRSAGHEVPLIISFSFEEIRKMESWTTTKNILMYDVYTLASMVKKISVALTKNYRYRLFSFKVFKQILPKCTFLNIVNKMFKGFLNFLKVSRD